MTEPIDSPSDLAAICKRAGIKGGYPRDPRLRGLAAVTHRSPLDDVHPCMMDPDADPPPQPSWRRWQAAHRKPDPNAPVLPSFLTLKESGQGQEATARGSRAPAHGSGIGAPARDK